MNPVASFFRYCGLRSRELGIALRAPVPKQLSSESRFCTITNLSPVEDLEICRIIDSGPLAKTVHKHTKLFKDTLLHPSGVPVFFFNSSHERNPFIYVGALGKVVDKVARDAIIEGNYFYLKELLDVKTGPKSVKQIDVIIAGRELYEFRHYSSEIENQFLETLLADKIKTALTCRGILPNATYSDTLVYMYDEANIRDYYTHLGCLGLLPSIVKDIIREKKYTILPHSHRLITHLSAKQYKSVSAIVLGVQNLDRRELRNNQPPGTYEKLYPVSKKKFPKLMTPIPPIDNSPLQLSEREVIDALSSPKIFKGSEERIGLKVLGELSSGTYAAENSHLRMAEYAEALSYPTTRYLLSTVEKHCAHYPDQIPVFSILKIPESSELKFLYGGPLSKVFDAQAHQDILEWNYHSSIQHFDTLKGPKVLETIITGRRDEDKNDIQKAFAYHMIKSALQSAANDGLKMGDHYSDVKVYLYSEELPYPFIQYLGFPLEDRFKDHIIKGNFTILPNAAFDSTPLSKGRLKTVSAIVVGTKKANWTNIFPNNAFTY